MIKNIFTHWRTTAPGVAAIITGVVTFVALVIDHQLTAPVATSLIMGIFGGLGLLFSQDYTQGARAHAESQAQIAELQNRSSATEPAIDTGDTSQLKRITMTPTTPPVVPPVAVSPNTH